VTSVANKRAGAVPYAVALWAKSDLSTFDASGDACL
jgi:hypothetical protein